MTTTTINLEIQSCDSHGMETKEIVVGLKKKMDNLMIYEYKIHSGKVELSLGENEFIMNKKNENNSCDNIKIMFDKTGKGSFDLKTEEFNGKFDVKKGKIVYNRDYIEISYEIHQGKEKINSLRVQLREIL